MSTACASQYGVARRIAEQSAESGQEPWVRPVAAVGELTEHQSNVHPRGDTAGAEAERITAGMDMGKTLIVDDEEDMRLLLRLTINREDRGLRVVGEASNGDEALTIRRELDIDVIVLDQRMPGLTGVETARALLTEEPDLPIVLYSAFLAGGVADEARQIGVRRCVEKGDLASLITALRELTGSDIGDPAP